MTFLTNLNRTAGDTLGSISAAANTLSTTLDAANDGAKMLKGYTQAELERQEQDRAANMKSRRHKLAIERATEDARIRMDLDKRLQDPEFKRYFLEAYDDYSSVLSPSAIKEIDSPASIAAG